MMLDPKHPLLVWMWRPGQMSAEDRRAFTALVERFQRLRATDRDAAYRLLHGGLLAWVPDRPAAVMRWVEVESAALGYPVQDSDRVR